MKCTTVVTEPFQTQSECLETLQPVHIERTELEIFRDFTFALSDQVMELHAGLCFVLLGIFLFSNICHSNGVSIRNYF